MYALALEALRRTEDAPAWWLALAPDGDMGRFFARFADGLAAATREPLGLWWSIGSERVAPSVLMTRGLPPASAFRELLGGSQKTGASVADAIVAVPQHWPSIRAVGARSAAISDVGRVRDENQDAFVERADDGLWLVADGMGGHQGGKMASQLVADSVKRVAVTDDVTAVARDVAAAIAAANAGLRSHGAVQPGFDGGSTVVALCVRGAEGIALWAGDSRLYRLRRGELKRLTRDHSVAEEAGSAPGEANMLTRAVGGADTLALEELRLDIRPGDRFLLCSDGLYGELTPEEIAARLAAPDCAAAANSLIALALEHGGGDNATAVVIAVDDDPA